MLGIICKSPALASILCAVVRRLRSEPHIIHFAVLQLPNITLKYPDIATFVEDAERLVDVVEETFLPT